MSALLLKKRCRDEEAPLDSVKRHRGETEQLILHLLEDIDSVDKSQQEEKCAPSEEVVSGVMRSLEEEIGLTSNDVQEGSSGLRRDDSVSSDTTSRCETHGVIDLDYLLEASDDELGIPPSPIQNLEDQNPSSSPSNGDGFRLSLDFAHNTELKSFVDNWLFEDDLVDYRQFAALEEPLANQGAFIDGDYPATS